MVQAMLEVSLFDRCIVGCKYCPQDLLRASLPPNSTRMMSFTTFATAVNKLPENSYVIFSGFTDASYHPQLLTFVDYAVKIGHKIALLSTLYGSSVSEYLALSEYEWEHFSIHIADSLGNTPLPEDTKLGKYLYLLDVVKRSPPKGYFIYNYHSGEPHSALDGFLPQCSSVYSIDLHDRAGNLKIENPVSKCAHIGGNIKCGHIAQFHYPKGSALMLPSGDCYLCCNDFGLKHKLGNILEQSWSDIVYSEEMHKINTGMSEDSLDTICRHCTSAVRA